MKLDKCMGIKVKYPVKRTVLTGTNTVEEQAWYWFGNGVNTVEEEEAQIRRNMKAAFRLIRKHGDGLFDRPYVYIYTGRAGIEPDFLAFTIHAPYAGNTEKLNTIRDAGFRNGGWHEALMTDAEIIDAVLEIYRRHGGIDG